MRIFHIASLEDWERAQQAGAYTTSTRGRTLAEEGFIHASRADQWQDVRAAFYADVTEPLVLLEVETDRLGARVVEESVPGSEQTFPHVYGPIEVDAVVAVRRLDRSFSEVFAREVIGNAALGLVLLLTVAAGVLVGTAVQETWGPWLGLVLGLVVGVVTVHRLYRRRS